MNIEELRRLKEELEKEDNKNKYAIVRAFDRQDIFNASAENLDTILMRENTDEVIHKCEDLMVKTLRGLVEKGIPFDQLVITSSLGLVCKVEYVDSWKQFYQEYTANDNADSKYTSLMNPLPYQVAKGIVPVSFSLNFIQTGMEDYNIDRYLSDSEMDYASVFFGRVSGIVDWEKFVRKMQEIGYTISLGNYENGNSFDDCVESVKQNGFETRIDIVADLGRIKKATPPRK